MVSKVASYFKRKLDLHNIMSMQYIEDQQHTGSSEPISMDSDRESNKSSDNEFDPVPTKEQDLFIWNPSYQKWHECAVMLYPPKLHIVEHEDQKLEVNEKQLKHLSQSWYHGTLSRRAARIILQDFGGGNGSFLVRTSESYHGKFAVSFVHDSSVKHVVIESRKDPITGILYNVTPNGPVFSSLYELIEEARRRPLIQNHSFTIKLTRSPPKPDTSWLHEGVKSLSQAEQILRKERRDGAFFVYKTQSLYAPYIVVYRSNGSILHNLITQSQTSSGYTLNHVTSQVLYKVVHYFMENPINEHTVLRYPVEDKTPSLTNTGIAVKDFFGDRNINELNFTYGALITNIQEHSKEWLKGDHRGDKQMEFKRNHIRRLSKQELEFVKEMKRIHCRPIQSETDVSPPSASETNTIELSLRGDYTVDFSQSDDQHGISIVFQPTNSSIEDGRSYKLVCPSSEDLESWYQALRKSNCLHTTQGLQKQLATKSRLRLKLCNIQ